MEALQKNNGINYAEITFRTACSQRLLNMPARIITKCLSVAQVEKLAGGDGSGRVQR